MKKKYFLLALILSCLCFAIFSNKTAKADDLNCEESNFINSIKDQAIEDYDKYNILPSVTIAQAILESSWGNYHLTKSSNNLFGMKTNDTWQGGTIVFPTNEYYKNVCTTIYATFKSYNSYSESIEDHCSLLNEDCYAAVKNSSNYVDACYSLYSCGYATNPKYSDMLIKVIQCFNLEQYDNFAKDQKATKDSYNNYYEKELILSNKILNTNVKDNNANNFKYFNDFSSSSNPTTSTKIEAEIKNTNSEKDKEDTNNIPKEMANNYSSNCNYWYVIYCLLQNYYPDIF